MATKIYSVKAELMVLRGLFHKRKEIAGTLLSGVDESYFYSEEAREIYNHVKDAVATDGSIPKYRLFLQDPQLSDNARSFIRESDALIESTADARKAMTILQKYRLRRGMHDLAHRIVDSLDGNRLREQQILDFVREQVQKLQTTKSKTKSFLHFGKMSNSKDFVHDLLYGDRSQNLIPTGLKAFDDMNHGLARGSLMILAGNSGAGKSQTAIQLAKNMAEAGYKVLFIPLEMAEDEVSARLLANVSRIDSLKIWSGKNFTDGERARVEKSYRRWDRRVARKGGDLAFFKPDADIGIEESLAAASTYGVDVVIIDYVSLLAGADGEDQWRQLGRIARYAKIDAETNNRLNMLVAQLNDEGKLKYSQTMREHANNLWAFTADRDDKTSGLRRVEQMKARNGVDRPFTIRIQAEISTVTTVDSDDVHETTTQSMPNLAASDI